MSTKTHCSIITMLLMISFASVNAVLFTPALPAIASYFAISDGLAQYTISLFLIGYALGQLIYGPLANRFGRKPALYIGIGLQIFSSLLCVFAGTLHAYSLLILGRFLLALGSGVGLKMTFTLINEMYEPAIASQKLSYLMIAFAITPGLAVMAGGILTTCFGWASTFYAGAAYGVLLLLLTTKLPETGIKRDTNALKPSHMKKAYGAQFKNKTLIAGGLLMGGATCFVYIFAAVAPFIAINIFHLSSVSYGTANLLPPIGLVLGSLFSAHLAKMSQPMKIIRLGILITFISSLSMFVFALLKMSVLLIIFISMAACYFGLALVFANASIIALCYVTDKAHGSAVMSFINMSFVTLFVLASGFLPVQILLMPSLFIIICIMMFTLYKVLSEHLESMTVKAAQNKSKGWC